MTCGQMKLETFATAINLQIAWYQLRELRQWIAIYFVAELEATAILTYDLCINKS